MLKTTYKDPLKDPFWVEVCKMADEEKIQSGLRVIGGANASHHIGYPDGTGHASDDFAPIDKLIC